MELDKVGRAGLFSDLFIRIEVEEKQRWRPAA